MIVGCEGHADQAQGHSLACLQGLPSPDSRTSGDLQAAEGMLGKLKGSLTYDEFKDVDLVVEAVIENLELKQKIFAGEPYRGVPLIGKVHTYLAVPIIVACICWWTLRSECCSSRGTT